MQLMQIAKLAAEYGLDITSMQIAGHQKFISVCLTVDPAQSYFVETAANGADHDIFIATLNIVSALTKIKERKEQEGRRAIKQRAHLVMNDIEPYISQIDGSLIGSRSKHRTHLRDHNCIEIGNEMKHMKHQKPLESPSGLKETIIRAVDEVKRKRSN